LETAPSDKGHSAAGTACDPFVDPSGCRLESDMQEAIFKATLVEEQKAEQQH